MANQFVVQLKNEPGAMANLAEALAARGVDLRAIGGGGIGDSGHVIMTTADDDTTKAVLDEQGYVYIEGESLVTEVDDKDGSELDAVMGVRFAQALHHGTDHRSQICTAMTSLGVEPPGIDVWEYGFVTGRVVERKTNSG